MKISAYETKPCMMYRLDETIREIKVANIENRVIPLNSKSGLAISMMQPDDRNTPPFGHPMIIDKRVYIDTRGSISGRGHDYRVTNAAEFEFASTRGYLTDYAQLHGYEDMANLGDLPLVSFARYLGESITRRLAFGPEEQMMVTVISALYYICLFKEKQELDDRDMQKYALRISRATRIPVEWILDRAAKFEFMDGVDDYVRVLRENVENPRMENLSVALLYGIVGGGWFGLNRNEVMAVALEHPPTWIAMVKMSVIDRSYRKSGVSMVVLNNDRNGASRQFLQNLSRMFEVA